MPVSEASSLPSAPAAQDGALVQRLEALCALAADTAGVVEPDALWAVLHPRAAQVLEADVVALRCELIGEPRAWAADGGDTAGLAALAERDGDEVQAVELPGGGAGLRIPLRHRGETLGTLVAGWRGGGGQDADTRRLAELLGSQAAATLANLRTYAELTEASFRRERFFSAMSHDLRTPITAIVGYSELLADGIVGDLNGQQLEMIERISQVSGHLSQLVNDILDLAKLDAGRMEFHREEVRLGDLVDEALVAVEPQARSKKLELRMDIDDHGEDVLRVDSPRVRQILVNLLSNAVKFTERGEVAVVAGSGNGRTWLEVRDTGPGVPPGSEEAVFEEFLQIAAGNKSKREPGSGLGLAISRRLARAMGGDLVARNVPGTGAAFTLVLPAQAG
ncbi:MAG TPA: GAF domain-containing sensor histidine kinase [Longimicrobium sp.]|jgi:signal transduction histidine kinase|uniref:GAF domain-containing sensor histidine kinase n=1 Tax=Longimicrobium sp. TaxID=2029185 RepID=UPI002ED95A69